MAHCHSIKQLEEKNVSNEIELMIWSDRMDIVALANAKGEVALHRLTWSRVWTLPPKKEGVRVVNMCWRLDGKILAIAYNPVASTIKTSEVLLVNVESKQVLQTIVIPSRISCLKWLQESSKPNGSLHTTTDDEQNDYLKFVDFSAIYLPNIQPLSNYSSGPNTSEENRKSNILQDQTALNFLAIGTEDGSLHLSVFGTFTCVVLNLHDSIRHLKRILNVHFSEELNVMFVTVCDFFDDVNIVAYNTDVFKTHLKELFVMASKHERLINLTDSLQLTITTITETWENILLEIDTKLSRYAAKMPRGGVTADFLDLLMFGIYSDELEEFLAHDIGKKGLEKFGTTIEMSYTHIQKLLLKYVLKIGQNIAYHLSELRGLARVEHRYEVLGLNVEKVSSAISSIGSFLIKTGEMQQIINHSLINYKAFFGWLYVAIVNLVETPVPPSDVLNMTQQDQANISEFLLSFDSMKGDNLKQKNSGFIMERVGQYLVDADLKIVSDANENEWDLFLSKHDCIRENPGVMKHCKEMSLVQQLKHLKGSINEIFSDVDCIQTQIEPLHRVNCVRFPENELSMSRVNYDKSSTFFAIVPDHKETILFLNIMYECIQDFKTTSGTFSFENGQSRSQILDVKFYAPNVLSLLLEETFSRKAFLCQFPALTATESLTLTDTCGKISDQNLLETNAFEIEGVMMKSIEGMVVSKFSVSGSRRVCIVLSENKRKVRLFEMEAEEEDDDEGDATMSTVKEGDVSMLHPNEISSLK